MNRKFKPLILIAILITTIFTPYRVVAQTEVECPNTWQINSESEFIEKYRALDSQLRNKYKGLNHYEKRILKWHWIFDAGEKNIKIFPPPMVQWIYDSGGPNEKVFKTSQEGPNWPSWGLVMAMVAPKSSINVFYEITVEGCPKSATFSLPVSIPAPNIVSLELNNSNSASKTIFSDETKLIEYKKVITPLINKVKRGNILKGFKNSKIQNIIKSKTVPYELGLFSRTVNLTNPYVTYLLPTQTQCLIFNPRGKMSLPIGKKCGFAIVLIDSKSASEKISNPRANLDIFILEEFSLKLIGNQ
jgi:hypothetical protein